MEHTFLEGLIGGGFIVALVWLIHVIYLNDKIDTLNRTLKQVISPAYPRLDKKVLLAITYYRRLYVRSRKYNVELERALRQMYQDIRSPLWVKVKSLSFTSLMEDYHQNLGVFSRDWTEVKFPSITEEQGKKEDDALTTELTHEIN